MNIYEKLVFLKSNCKINLPASSSFFIQVLKLQTEQMKGTDILNYKPKPVQIINSSNSNGNLMFLQNATLKRVCDEWQYWDIQKENSTNPNPKGDDPENYTNYWILSLTEPSYNK